MILRTDLLAAPPTPSIGQTTGQTIDQITNSAAALNLPPAATQMFQHILAKLPAPSPRNRSATSAPSGEPVTPSNGNAPVADSRNLTIAWLAARSPYTRINCLATLASWIDYVRMPTYNDLEVEGGWVEGWLDHCLHAARDNRAQPALVLGNHLRTLRSWYKFLIQHGAWHSAPTVRVRAPVHRPTPRQAALSRAAGAVIVEIARAAAELQATDETAWRDYTIVAAQFYTPAPDATLAHISFADVVGLHTGGTVSVWTGEMSPARTLIDLPDTVALPLRTYLGVRAHRENAPPYTRAEAPMFCTVPPPGAPTSPATPLTSQRIGLIVKSLAARGGLPGLTRLTLGPTPPTHPAATPIPIRVHREPADATNPADHMPVASADSSHAHEADLRAEG
ncbi:hypothetical protein [Nonomuraea soli]|uniref:Core-binding (CB) domain-containing protein n=1 Tax=Nonomuraea soli TaxID=1032476 RepID=A0A7W0HW72_9ACTN|nr:hypothetical protein [Nonomuraea soli]MBA2897802.1 hypothetical protein [Nonomuraea soli]